MNNNLIRTHNDNFFMHMLFTLKNIAYSVPVHCVVEVLPFCELQAPQKLQQYTVGLLDYNGIMINIIDLKEILGLEKEPFNINQKFLLVKTEESIFGIVVDTIFDVADINSSTIQIAPHNAKNLIQSIYNFSDKTVSVINIPAIENESNVIRMPSDAMMTLGIKVNDTVLIDNNRYIINSTRNFEPDILRLPLDVKNALHVDDGDIIQNSRMIDVFDKSVVSHNIKENNVSYDEKYMISSRQSGSWSYELIVDNVSISNSTGVFLENESYSIMADDSYVGSIGYVNSTIENKNFTSLEDPMPQAITYAAIGNKIKFPCRIVIGNSPSKRLDVLASFLFFILRFIVPI